MSRALGLAAIATTFSIVLSACVPQAFTNPPPRSSTPTPTATPSPTPAPTPPAETFLVGTDATHNAISILSLDTSTGVLTPVGVKRDARAARTPRTIVLTSGTTLPTNCAPGAMSVSGHALAVVCTGTNTLDLFALAPGTGTSVTIDLAGVQTCPLGGNPGLLRSARMREADGEHTLYEVLDRTSYAVTLCDLTPAGLHSVGSFTLPSPRIPVDFALRRGATGAAYPFYETYGYAVGTSSGVSLYGLTETGSHTLINEILPVAAGPVNSLLGDCDDGIVITVVAGRQGFSRFDQATLGGPIAETPILGAPFVSTQTGPTWPGAIGAVFVPGYTLPYTAVATTDGSLQIFGGSFGYVTSGTMPGTPAIVHGYGGAQGYNSYFGTLYNGNTNSTLSTYKFDGATLSPRLDYSLSYRLNDFGVLRYGYPRPAGSPTPSPTPTPVGSYGAVVLSPPFLGYGFIGQTQSFTAQQTGNPNNIFTYTGITCPAGNNGAGTITQPTPGTFNVTVTSPSGTANCQSTITGLGNISAQMQFNF